MKGKRPYSRVCIVYIGFSVLRIRPFFLIYNRHLFITMQQYEGLEEGGMVADWVFNK